MSWCHFWHNIEVVVIVSRQIFLFIGNSQNEYVLKQDPLSPGNHTHTYYYVMSWKCFSVMAPVPLTVFRWISKFNEFFFITYLADHNFARITTVILSWRVHNSAIIGLSCYKPEFYKIVSNFEHTRSLSSLDVKTAGMRQLLTMAIITDNIFHKTRKTPLQGFNVQIRKIDGCPCAGNAGSVFPATAG